VQAGRDDVDQHFLGALRCGDLEFLVGRRRIERCDDGGMRGDLLGGALTSSYYDLDKDGFTNYSNGHLIQSRRCRVVQTARRRDYAR